MELEIKLKHTERHGFWQKIYTKNRECNAGNITGFQAINGQCELTDEPITNEIVIKDHEPK